MELVNILVYNEEAYENALIELFQNLGYNHYYGPDIERDYKNPLFKMDLENLYRINRFLDKEAIDKTIETIQDFGIGSLEDKNNKFTEYLQNGVSVNYWKDGKEESTHVKLVDFDNLDSRSAFSSARAFQSMSPPEIMISSISFILLLMSLT